MNIIELKHYPERSIKSAIVRLDYDEIRDIVNILYHACKDEKNKDRTSYHQIHRDMFLLFELVKNSCIDSFTVEQLGKLQDAIKESKENNK